MLIFDDAFSVPVNKISFCTTCCFREKQLQRVLLRNAEIVARNSHVEWIIVHYLSGEIEPSIFESLKFFLIVLYMWEFSISWTGTFRLPRI